jgi:hypothetical protein
MCKIGSERHYVLCLDALSASRCNRLNTLERSLKSPMDIRLYGSQRKKIIARIEIQSLCY